jgi:5-(carboxyamino)imidazole ribonucleotide synthase
MSVILPGATIGVIGGGQLGRMLALQARRMGYVVVVLDPDPHGPGAQVASSCIAAPLDDVDAALELARRCDVITLEWENADTSSVVAATEIAPVRPGAHVLKVAQDRLAEKDAARRLGVPTADYRPVRTLDELDGALADLGTPAVLKTARGGYDGKGQRVIREPEEAAQAFSTLSDGSVQLILERWVPFRLEVSVICARTPAGEIATFPVAENIHRDGILDFTIAPARLQPDTLRNAAAIGEALVEGLNVVGLLAVELFVDEDERVYMNEIAPRPHNSGHYTWEACTISQFEQQLRAVCGLPLERPRLLRPAAMVNLLGQHIGTGMGLPGIADALAIPGAALHLYGKRAARHGRKMGHVTVLADSPEEAHSAAERARQALVASYHEAQNTRAAADTLS